MWPFWVRLIHWGVAGACVYNFWLSDEGEELHRLVGYGASALVFVRLLAGVIAKRPELRLGSMFKALGSIPGEVTKLYRREPLSLTRGHSPLASPVMLGMWACVLGLGLTGWMLEWEAFFGSEGLEELHEFIANGLMVLVAAHLAGLVHESISHRTRAWMGMIDGRKKTD